MQNLILFKQKHRYAKMKESEDKLKHINKHQQILDLLVAVDTEFHEDEKNMGIITQFTITV